MLFGYMFFRYFYDQIFSDHIFMVINTFFIEKVNIQENPEY